MVLRIILTSYFVPKYLFLFNFQAKPMSIRPFFVFISVVVGGRLKMSLGTIVKSFG